MHFGMPVGVPAIGPNKVQHDAAYLRLVEPG
jgi:hypothetical protein